MGARDLIIAATADSGVGKTTIEMGNIIFDEAYCADHAGDGPEKYVLLAVSVDVMTEMNVRDLVKKLFSLYPNLKTLLKMREMLLGKISKLLISRPVQIGLKANDECPASTVMVG